MEVMTAPRSPSEGFKWPVTVRRTIAAPAPKIWELISSPGALPLYHPFCEKNPVFEWPGPESYDEIHYFNGVVLTRRFTAWYDDVGYDLEIGRNGGRTSFVTWRTAQVKERRSSIAITICPHAVQKVPVIARWMPHIFWLRPQLRRYLQSVVKGIDWFVNHGEPVRRNQFGAHRWFSPPVSPAA
jgi:hypothetical protein